MSMLPDGIIPIGEGGNGRVFDFVCTSGVALITDYRHLDRDVWAENSIKVKLGGEKDRISVTSIEDLKDILNKFLSATLEILSSHVPFDPIDPYSYPDFSNIKRDLLIEQLVFDILFDKYLHESELMTRNGYSDYMGRLLYGDNLDGKALARAINGRLTHGMEVYHDRTAYSKLREQIKLLGADPDKYAKYYTPHMRENPRSKKPKFIWDVLYYNSCLNLTYRQYRRQLTRDNRNYSYEEILTDLKEYNDFVTKLMPAERESYEKYFRMSMDYYVLESYKRVDFMFKLTDTLSPDKIAAINRHHFLVNRFAPPVLIPYIQDSTLVFRTEVSYYRPLFIIEEELLKEAFPQEVQMCSNSCEMYYKSLLEKYQNIRAKAYELFKYHCVFSSNDYVEIKKFLCECYDMRSYHQSNAFWNLIRDKSWKQMTDTEKQQIKERSQHLLSINNALFWVSPDRDYIKPETNN